MWTRSKEQNGTHSVTVYGLDGDVYRHQGGFNDFRDAERQAEKWQREALFGIPAMSLDDVLDDMIDEEMLNELFS